MAKEGDYTIENLYQGGYSSLKPPTQHYVTAGSMGLTTDPRSANILKEVSAKLASGVKQIELATVSPEIFEAIPKQHLKEVNRLSKLTGVDISVHGPVVDTTGINQQGFSEINREATERKLKMVVERSHELSPDGNIPVTFHSAEGIPGTEFEMTPEGRKPKRLVVINRESGKPTAVEAEKKYYPGTIKVREEMLDPKKQLKALNDTEWDNSLSQVEFNREHAERILKDTHPMYRALYLKVLEREVDPGSMSDKEHEEIKKIHSAGEYLKQAEMTVRALFSRAYKYGTEENKKVLDTLSEQYGKELGIKENGKIDISSLDPKRQSNALFVLANGLQSVNPNIYTPIEDFAIDQSSKTFGNVAFESYKKFKDKAPIVNIENPPAGFALSTGEELRKLIEKSREQFVTKAVEEGMSKSEAKRQAEKLIGATWDVGHINMMRKYGWEEKDIIKESEKIAPLVKHVHLSDNFGFEHTELPMGMGNVPIQEIMKKLGKKGYEAKKIIEAGHWWQHFQTSPFKETMEAMGSPIYSMEMAPYWNQAPGFQQDYFGGFGMILPQINYETFGAGFSQLPAELGGQRQGAQGGRMGGSPME
ncbi:MAG TPA: sugar phosphate isomerase/epimerase [Candidatus Pacearchaeota archaeon]|nr:xylose isomerase-like TIM barrel [archaeon BMS3Abin17]HDK42643.1 sugar phosphate isomerase/epimerase [Candidatus Pacearchaeota archaeon]HDZ60855.1 sugar phosphate isomerase/epimerase [Candidatus Pacearchaeota archaeon]